MTLGAFYAHSPDIRCSLLLLRSNFAPAFFLIILIIYWNPTVLPRLTIRRFESFSDSVWPFEKTLSIKIDCAICENCAVSVLATLTKELMKRD